MNAYLVLVFLLSSPTGQVSVKQIQLPWPDMESCHAYLQHPDPIGFNFGQERIVDVKMGCMGKPEKAI
jgi:hypothetical protein